MALEKCLDSQLWHACAGGMVQIPLVDSKVYYFPEGHAEQAGGIVDFSGCPKIPAMILCRVISINYMADRDNDEVFVKMRLVPVHEKEEVDDGRMVDSNSLDGGEKPASFAKTLTQSDANNGGGFSVPRYCAETIFPRLDYSAHPPVQMVLVKDVHGELWKFRHIYRGTPRRHLLTTGWSNFVSQKRLVAGDSVVFLRADNGDLCIGIRRANRRGGNGVAFPSSWNQFANCFASLPGSPAVVSKEETKALKTCGSSGGTNIGSGAKIKGKVSSASVLEAGSLAARGQPFEIVYYPRAGTPEFFVGASTVRDAMRIRWVAGMRFKMAFETEDSSRISWFMGTIGGTQVADPVRWPNSPWRILQVSWDEPDLLQNVNNVNPWLVELVSNIPAVHMEPLSPPLKKMCLAQQSDSPLKEQISTSLFSTNPFLQSSSSPVHYPPSYAPAGIQGARHAQLDISLTNLQHNKLQQSLFLAGTRDASFRHPTAVTIKDVMDDKTSHFSTMRSPSLGTYKSPKATQFVLFGKLILTEKQLTSGGSSAETTSATANSSSDGNTEKSSNLSDDLGSVICQYGPSNDICSGGSPQHKEQAMIVGSGNFPETYVLNSPDVLDAQFGGIFGMNETGIVARVVYQDPVDTRGKDCFC